MNILDRIQSKYPDATQDEFQVRDEGFGPYFSFWAVRDNGRFAPKPTYEEVMTWGSEDDGPDYDDGLSSRVADLEGQPLSDLTQAQKDTLLEALARHVGALTSEGLVRPLVAFGASEEVEGPNNPFTDPFGGSGGL